MSSPNSPHISVIIPTYNSERTLHKSLSSILSQSFKDFEILILDNNSSDNTSMISNSFEDDRIKFLCSKDNGVYDAMNKGIGLATGEWIYFLGSDDTLASDYVLEKIFNEAKDSTADLIYGKVIIAEKCEAFGEELNWIKIFQKCPCHQAVFYKRDLFEKYGLYNLKYPINADWEKNIIFFNSQIDTKFLDIIVAVFSNQGISGRNYDKNLFSNLLSLKKGLTNGRSVFDKISYFAFSDIGSSKLKKCLQLLLKNSILINSKYNI